MNPVCFELSWAEQRQGFGFFFYGCVFDHFGLLLRLRLKNMWRRHRERPNFWFLNKLRDVWSQPQERLYFLLYKEWKGWWGGKIKDLWEDKNTPHPLFNPGAIVWLPETFPHRKTTWLYPQFAKEVRQCLLSGWAHEREQFFQRCEGGFWLDDDKHLRDSLTVTHSHSCSYGSSTLGDFRWWTRSKNLHSLVALCWFWLRQGLFSHLYSPSSVSEKFNPGSPSFILNRPTSAFLFTVFV